jgi:hypothetical protein
MRSTTPCLTSPCDSPIAERPRYFPRQILTPDDLTLEQEYFRNKLRRHNRIMHGWGVVCGARICLVRQPGVSPNAPSSYQPWVVSVTPGYLLGPYGDEILLDCCRTVDLRTEGASGVTGESCVQPVDPWCSEVFVQRDSTKPLYIAVKYKECKARPMRVQPVGCGCDDSACEYSRLRDGYEIGVLTSCPNQDEQPPNLEDLSTGGTPDCPDCPDQPWVVLGAVQMDADGTIHSIDNCRCRRIVMSFGGYWRPCQSGMFSIKSVAADTGEVDPQKLPQGGTTKIVVTFDSGSVIDTDATLQADLGPGVTVTVADFKPDKFSALLDVTALATAAPGPRTMTAITSDGSEASVEKAVNIVAASPAITGPVPKPIPAPSPPPKPVKKVKKDNG